MVRFRPNKRGVALYVVAPSANGLWSAAAAFPSNETNDRAQKRAAREGAGGRLASALAAIDGVQAAGR